MSTLPHFSEVGATVVANPCAGCRWAAVRDAKPSSCAFHRPTASGCAARSVPVVFDWRV